MIKFLILCRFEKDQTEEAKWTAFTHKRPGYQIKTHGWLRHAHVLNILAESVRLVACYS